MTGFRGFCTNFAANNQDVRHSCRILLCGRNAAPPIAKHNNNR